LIVGSRPIFASRASPKLPVSQIQFCGVEVSKAVIGDLTLSAIKRQSPIFSKGQLTGSLLSLI